MTPTQLMKYFNNNKSETSRTLGCSRATLGNWMKDKHIPIQWQCLIEKRTNGALKEDVC